MRWSRKEILADPVRTLDEIVGLMAGKALLSFAGNTTITPEELAAVAEMNMAVAAEAREEIRQLLVRELRKAGEDVGEDFGLPESDSLEDVEPIGHA
jgi:hypothetical protein